MARTILRATRVGNVALIECDRCGPVGVLNPRIDVEAQFVSKHMSAHNTGNVIVTNQEQP